MISGRYQASGLRRAIAAGSMLIFAMVSACSSSAPSSDWPEWDNFVGRFVREDGHVVDVTFDRKTVSEGQAYAMFFALVANQRSRFDTILQWTSVELAQGRLGEKLPDWYWGPLSGGGWGIKDPTSASDADLWMAYTLLEAARLWNVPAYAETGRKMLRLIQAQEIVDTGLAGPALLPGVVGFNDGDQRFWIDPSYLPGFIFSYLATVDPQGPWQRVWDSYVVMALRSFSAGVAPDLFVVDSQGKLTQDTQRPPSGSYDAIRVYLWAGMSGRNSEELVRLLAPYADLTDRRGAPPEKVDPVTGAATTSGFSPIGFSGAMLPFLSALGDRHGLDRQYSRLRWARIGAALGRPTNYYDQALILFGKGWIDGRYRFDAQGRLQPKWAEK